MTVKLALPTGEPRAAVGALLEAAGIAVPEYVRASRVLRETDSRSGLTARVFRERDILVQVASGNYDLGICGEVWLAEQQVRFPLQHVVVLGGLPGPESEVWVAASEALGCDELQLPASSSLQGGRIAAEFANLADLFAVHARIPGYRLMPIHGSADAYPPEDAELVLTLGTRDQLLSRDLVPLHRLFAGGLVLIANADALASKDLSSFLGGLSRQTIGRGPGIVLPSPGAGPARVAPPRRKDVARLALPDGHAQRHTHAALSEAGLSLDGYDEKSYVRRPRSAVEGLEVKVIRPQDMPAMVALGLFDMAITGRDLLEEHRCLFPNSPVQMSVDLRRSRYRIGPVVDRGFAANSTTEALTIWSGLGRPVRVASEFPALAEAFARDSQLAHTEIMPIAGASEGFVPEDADVLIEGSETGASIAANGLKMLDPFLESTNCLIVRSQPVTRRTDVVDQIVERLALAAAAVEQ
ncbi:MAG: ATP phosphoribosyltransferase [Dehalococcoidia bacterium]